ncbi:MAG: ABC transporter substrate-binding protein [Thermoanaerobaculia bacterium]|nr:ABC transporter substrate-binding protein [Thermoanaerobaculia bacterium]
MKQIPRPTSPTRPLRGPSSRAASRLVTVADGRSWLWRGSIALLVAWFAACNPPAPTSESSSHSESEASEKSGGLLHPSIDEHPDPVEIAFAESFRVSYHRHYKVVQLRNGDDDEWRETLVLVRRGAPAPSLDGELADAVVIEIPVRSIATNAVSDISRLRTLGLIDRLVGIPTAAVYDEEIYRRHQSGELAAIGHPGHGQPNLEALLAAGPDLTLLLTTGPEHAQGIQRLRDLGLAAAPSYAFTESTFLGRAEWIVYLALFFDAEAAAQAHFDGVVTRYLALSERAKAAAGASPPVAFWGGPAGGNRWWVERNGPEAELFADAGALNPLADPSAGPFATLDTASVLNAAADADLWITSALAENDWDGRVPLELFAAYRAGRVYHNRKRMRLERDAWDWNETAINRPDLALADLVSLLHPELLPDHELHFFAPVARQ